MEFSSSSKPNQNQTGKNKGEKGKGKKKKEKEEKEFQTKNPRWAGAPLKTWLFFSPPRSPGGVGGFFFWPPLRFWGPLLFNKKMGEKSKKNPLGWFWGMEKNSPQNPLLAPKNPKKNFF